MLAAALFRHGVAAAVLLTSAACSSPGHEIYDDFNTRDTGQYVGISRSIGGDGSLLLHVSAEQPEHGQEIAWELVRLSYASSPSSVRVVVDPMHGGERQVYRWDGHDLRVDASHEGLPPRQEHPPQRSSRP